MFAEFPLPLLQQMCWRWRPPLYLFITRQNSNINKPQTASFRFPKHPRQPSYSSHDHLWIRLKWWCTGLHGGLRQARHLFFPKQALSLFSSYYVRSSSAAAAELKLAEFAACTALGVLPSLEPPLNTRPKPSTWHVGSARSPLMIRLRSCTTTSALPG